MEKTMSELLTKVGITHPIEIEIAKDIAAEMINSKKYCKDHNINPRRPSERDFLRVCRVAARKVKHISKTIQDNFVYEPFDVIKKDVYIPETTWRRGTLYIVEYH